VFGIDDGGVSKTVTWDADVDKWKHSAGTFDFDDDDIVTTGDVTCNVLNYTTLNPPVSISPGGSDTQIQYNNAGSFGGIASFVWDGSNVKILADNTEFYSSGDDVHLHNVTQDADLVFGIDDGGVSKTVTWDADVDQWKHSAGTFDFDDDHIVTTGDVTCNVLNYTTLNPAISPGGSDTQIQYNNAGSFNGIASFVWDGSNVKISSNTVKLILGASGSASTYYDGTDLVFDSQEAGSGNFNFLNGVIEVDGEQTIYNAQALDGFTGSFVVGDGGINLSHVSGSEGYYNTFVGVGAGRLTTTGYGNISVGVQALYDNTTGWGNLAIGYLALQNNTTGGNNTALGYQALYTNTEGWRNVAIGYYTLQASTTSSDNIALGHLALQSNTTGNRNIAIGSEALDTSTDGADNIAVGYRAIKDITSGQFNIGVGYNTGRGITTGNYNTIIGGQVTGLSSTLANYVIIADGQGNQRIIVDNNGDAEINGDLKIDGKFSTGTTTVSATGPTDNVDVAACNIVFLDTSSNNVTIGGFINGVVGQVIRVVRLDSTNDATLEHNEATGNQDIFLANEADHTISTYGGWTLVCNGTHWFEAGY
jgi:hypothetical protein